jgi:hypothetical protein
MHEASQHADNAFVTLTYSDEHLPEDGSVSVREWQLFAKRLRKRHSFRFFMCGEYGALKFRPHYHALLFGVRFADAVKVETRGDYHVLWSEELERTWGKGLTEIGQVSFESAAYVARYSLKKLAPCDLEGRAPEFVSMSRRHGIGRSWFEQHAEEVISNDSVIVNGFEAKPPRYYDTLVEACEPRRAKAIRKARDRARRVEDESSDRLRAREVVAKAKVNLKSRRLV